MKRFKLAWLSLLHLITSAGFHLLEHSAILVRYYRFVLSVCSTVLFLFFTFLIAAVFLRLATVFLHVAILRGRCQEVGTWRWC